MRRRVLVFDDRHLVSTIVKIYVTGLDLDVVRATNPDKAWSILRTHEVAFIVSDLEAMPGAISLARSACILEPTGVRGVPSILLSAEPRRVPSLTPEQLVLPKPVYREGFLDAIRRIMPATVDR